MSQSNFDYFRLRAEQEREAARKASEPYIAAIHSELADGYEAVLRHPESRPALKIVAG